jgi:hypothetical protein
MSLSRIKGHQAPLSTLLFLSGGSWWRKIPKVMGIGLPSLPWNMVPTLRARCAVLVLTSGFGREEKMRKGHHGGSTNHRHPGCFHLSERMGLVAPGCYVTRLGKGPGRHFLYPSMGMAPTTTQDLQNGGGGFHLASEYKA